MRNICQSNESLYYDYTSQCRGLLELCMAVWVFALVLDNVVSCAVIISVPRSCSLALSNVISDEWYNLLHFELYIGMKNHIIQLCSGITRSWFFNGELYAQRLQKLVYLHLVTNCFMEISLQSSKQILQNHYMCSVECYRLFYEVPVFGLREGTSWERRREGRGKVVFAV